MVSEAPASERAFLRGERRLTVREYIGLVASCQSAFDAGMAQLSPASQVVIWNSFHPHALLPSSGRRMLWALRRGVLDDLAPKVESLLPGEGRWAPTKDEQLAFRAVLEALATGRKTQSEIIAFCNEIYPWSPVLGVAEYIRGDLAAAVRLATLEVASDVQPRWVRLPSWALVGTLLDAVRAARGWSDSSVAAFSSALGTLLGPAKRTLTIAHAQLLVRLYWATRAGRKASAPEDALRAIRGGTRQRVAFSQEVVDRLREFVQELESLRLIQSAGAHEIRWLALTLIHLPPGQGARAQPP